MHKYEGQKLSLSQSHRNYFSFLTCIVGLKCHTFGQKDINNTVWKILILVIYLYTLQESKCINILGLEMYFCTSALCLFVCVCMCVIVRGLFFFVLFFG